MGQIGREKSRKAEKQKGSIEQEKKQKSRNVCFCGGPFHPLTGELMKRYKFCNLIYILSNGEAGEKRRKGGLTQVEM